MTATGRLITLDEAASLAAPWQALADRAIEPNPFYAPTLAVPALRHLAEGRRSLLATAWRKSAAAGDKPCLVGLLPVVDDRRYLLPVPHRCAPALTSALTLPLFGPDEPADTAAALLDALRAGSVRALLLPHLPADGPASAALYEACERVDLHISAVGHQERPFLDPVARPTGSCLDDGPGPLEPPRAGLATRRRKEAERQRRRLGEVGKVTFRVVRAPEEVAEAVDEFLALEARGWKGQSGTALAVTPGGVPFARAAWVGLAREGALLVATLLLDARPIAVGVVVFASGRAFYHKTTYDEALARFSPGLLLTLDLTTHLLGDPRLDGADSLAVADHPMIARVWSGRRTMVSLVVGTRPGAVAAPHTIATAERWREALRLRTLPSREALRAGFSSRGRGIGQSAC